MRIVHSFLLSLLLATQVFGQCKPFNFPAPSGTGVGHNLHVCVSSPEGVQAGQRGDRAIVVGAEAEYKFTGTPGATTGWVPTVQGLSFCGDRSVNQSSEQCDVVDGTGAQGACATLDECIEPGEATLGTPCTCANTPATCGNGIIDAGEGCDINFNGEAAPCDGSIVVGGQVINKCTQDCKCIAECGNGDIETNTTTGVNEECDFSTEGGGSGGGTDFGQALSSGGTAPSSLSTQATDTGDFDYDDEDFIIEMLVTFNDLSGSTKQLFHKNGVAAGSPGYSLRLLGSNSGQLSLIADEGAQTDTCNSATGAVAVGVPYHLAFTRDGANCKFWLRAMNDPEQTVHTDVTSGTNADIDDTTWDLGDTPVGIGGQADGDEPCNCTIDEVRVWSCIAAGTCVSTYTGTNLTTDPINANAALEVTSGTDLDGRWDFDQNPPIETLGNVTGSLVGSASLIASPFSSSGGGTGTPEEFGCTPPEFCNPTSCVCQSSGGTTGTTRYVDDTGCSNSNDGSTGARWCTVPWAFDASNPRRLGPGDTLVIGNGMYTHDVHLIGGSTIPALTSNGLCDGSGANAPCGTSTAPITIKAENSRRAWWVGNGMDPVWKFVGLSWYILEGITVQQTDLASENGTNNDSNVAINRSSDLVFNDWLVDKNMRCGNNQLFQIDDGQDITVNRLELWRHGRHGASVSGGIRVIFNHLYDNNAYHDWGQCPGGLGCPAGCANSGGPESGTAPFYPCNNCTLVNSAGEGSWGFSFMAAPGAINGIRAADNWAMNSVYAAYEGTGLGAKINGRGNEAGSSVPEGTVGSRRGPLRTTFKDMLFVDPKGLGIRVSVAVDTLIDNVTVWKNVMESSQANGSLVVDDPGFDSNSQSTCDDLLASENASITIRDSIFSGSTGTDVSIPGCTSSENENMVCTIPTGTGADGGNYTDGGNDYSCPDDGGNCDTACAASGALNRALPTGIGDTGTTCLHGSTYGADLRCEWNPKTRTKLTGLNSSMFCTNVSQPGCGAGAEADMATTDGTCTADRAEGTPLQACRYGFPWCGAIVDGINDKSGCWSFAHRRMRQLAGGTQCTGSALTATGTTLACQ